MYWPLASATRAKLAVDANFLLRFTYQPASAHERLIVSQRVGHSQALALFGLWLVALPFA